MLRTIWPFSPGVGISRSYLFSHFFTYVHTRYLLIPPIPLHFHVPVALFLFFFSFHQKPVVT